MNGNVGTPFQHGLFQLFDKQALAAHFRQRRIQNLIPASGHRNQLNNKTPMMPLQGILHIIGLP